MNGERILRKSLMTRDAAQANARMARLVETCAEALHQQYQDCDACDSEARVRSTPPSTRSSSLDAPSVSPPVNHDENPTLVKNAIKAFLANCETNGVQAATLRKYRNSLSRLVSFAESNGILLLAEIKVIHLDQFRAEREIAPITSLKELETLRQFWSYCVARELCKENVAMKIAGPKISSPNNVEPYSTDEIKRIIAATEEFGRTQYERKRAKAIVLVLRYTALRISDVATLRRDRIMREGGRWVIFVRTTKNKKRVFLPIPRQLKEALDEVPNPRGASPDCPYYFWAGNSKVKSQVSVVEECVTAVFRTSGVEKAHAHRFRHTLATESLGAGGSFEDVADILGDSVEVVKKHYAKWSSERQARVTDLLSRVHGDADWSCDNAPPIATT